jgi:MoxR-like ATPase
LASIVLPTPGTSSTSTWPWHIRATRPRIFKPVGKYIELGASPRAAIMIVRASQAHALLRGDSTVSEEDVTTLLFPALNHRLVPSMEAVVESEERHGRLRARIEVVREGIEFVSKNLP